ncbi:MAG: OmpA family protein [Bacteroidota bacterium]
MKLVPVLFLGLLLATLCPAQKRINLVPNPSFEDLFNLPVRPNPRNSFEFEPKSGYKPFQKNTKFWFAGSKTTPDLRITTDDNYSECRRRYPICDKARTGDMMVGIITYLRNSYTDSYREYVQTKLGKALRPGVKTYVELWIVKERQAKLVSNNIGIYFSDKKVEEDTEVVVKRTPQINIDSVINLDSYGWVRIVDSFIPDKPLRFMTIGNFYDNQKTELYVSEHFHGSPYTPPYAYYLLDDLRVWQKEEEEEPQERPSSPLVYDTSTIQINEAVRLDDIHFRLDRSELEPASLTELEKLHQLLQDYPSIKIDIHGHTDNQANDSYNMQLSTARARAVYHYLLDKGIPGERMSYKGFGERQPIDTNDTELGKANNRRVEFIVLPK